MVVLQLKSRLHRRDNSKCAAGPKQIVVEKTLLDRDTQKKLEFNDQSVQEIDWKQTDGQTDATYCRIASSSRLTRLVITLQR